MQFKPLALIATVLSATQVVNGLSVDDLVDTIDEVTSASKDTAEVAKKITDPGSLLESAPVLVKDFLMIVKSVASDITMLADVSDTSFDKHDQSRVCDAFHDFVVVHQNLLNIVIGKDGLLSNTPITGAVGAVLRLIEGGVDSLAESIIGLVPTCKKKAMGDLKDLDATLGKAINTYGGDSKGLDVGGILGKLTGSSKGGDSGGDLLGSVTGGVGDLAGGLTGGLTGGSMKGDSSSSSSSSSSGSSSGGDSMGSVTGGNMQGGSGDLLGGLLSTVGGLLGGR